MDYNAMIQYSCEIARIKYVNKFRHIDSEINWDHSILSSDKQKMLTVVIPTWDSDESLLKLINDLRPSSDLIVIKVIQDGYCEKTSSLVNNLKRAFDLDMQYLFVRAQPKPAYGDEQRMWACQECDTPYIWLVDDDNQIYEDAIRRIDERLRSNMSDALFVNIDYDGKQVNIPELNGIDINCKEDIRFQHCDTMSIVFNPRIHSWNEKSYTADFNFIKTYIEKTDKIEFLGGDRVAKYRGNL